MEKKVQLTAADILQGCSIRTVKDENGDKCGIVTWVPVRSDSLQETVYHQMLDAVFDMVKGHFPETDIGVTYRFFEDGIWVIGGEHHWFVTEGNRFSDNIYWWEALVDVEVSRLPECSSFVEFMNQLEAQGQKDRLMSQLTLFKKPAFSGELGKAMKSVRRTVPETTEVSLPDVAYKLIFWI
jgi:hypothetical protein